MSQGGHTFEIMAIYVNSAGTAIVLTTIYAPTLIETSRERLGQLERRSAIHAIFYGWRHWNFYRHDIHRRSNGLERNSALGQSSSVCLYENTGEFALPGLLSTYPPLNSATSFILFNWGAMAVTTESSSTQATKYGVAFLPSIFLFTFISTPPSSPLS